MAVGRIFLRGRGTIANFSRGGQRIFSRGGETVVKFHFINSKLREINFYTRKISNFKIQVGVLTLLPPSEVHVSNNSSIAKYTSRRRRNTSRHSRAQSLRCTSIYHRRTNARAAKKERPPHPVPGFASAVDAADAERRFLSRIASNAQECWARRTRSAGNRPTADRAAPPDTATVRRCPWPARIKQSKSWSDCARALGLNKLSLRPRPFVRRTSQGVWTLVWGKGFVVYRG